MVPFVQWVVGAIVSVLGNAVYIDMRRRGARGFGRFVAFWTGLPVSFLSSLAVREGRPPRFDPSFEDDQELLREVRLDRERRALREPRE